MKTNFLLISICLFITIKLQAQDFAPVGAKWYFPEYFAFSGNQGVITYESIGDTIINNLSCRIIEKSRPSCFIPISGEIFLHEKGDTIQMYYPELDTFKTIIDFGAEVGDSWVIDQRYALFQDTVECKVDSMSIYVDANSGLSFKTQHVTLTS